MSLGNLSHGIFTGTGEIGRHQGATDIDIAVIRAAFEPNFFGLIQTTTTFLPLLRSSSTLEAPSVILNVSTDMASNSLMAGPHGFLHNLVAYNTSKAAVNSYTIALAHELKEEGIKVNCATPGFTSTALNGFKDGAKTEQGAEMLVKWAILGKDDKTGTCRTFKLFELFHELTPYLTGLFVNDAGEFPW